MATIGIFQFVLYLTVHNIHAHHTRITVYEHIVGFHVLFDYAYHIFIFKGQNTIAFVDQVHFGAFHHRENSGKFTAYHPGPQDYHTTRESLQIGDAIAGHDDFLIYRDFGQLARPAAGGQDDVLGINCFFAALGGYLHLMWRAQIGMPFDKGDILGLSPGAQFFQMHIEQGLALFYRIINLLFQLIEIKLGSAQVVARLMLVQGIYIARQLPPGFGRQRTIGHPCTTELITLYQQYFFVVIYRAHGSRIA